jgi:hypothetical protein
MSDQGFYPIMKELTSELGKSMIARPYMALVDASGKIRYFDDALDDYKNYIIEFTRSNFTLLKVGDHSIPLGGTNLAFFKCGNNFFLVIHSKAGPTGQLLAFKNLMSKYSEKFAPLVGEVQPIVPQSIEVEPEIKKVEKKKEEVMKPRHIVSLTKKVNLSKKFSLEETKILELCGNGNHTIEEICDITTYSKLKVESVIRKFKKKGWVAEKTVIA